MRCTPHESTKVSTDSGSTVSMPNRTNTLYSTRAQTGTQPTDGDARTRTESIYCIFIYVYIQYCTVYTHTYTSDIDFLNPLAS